MRTFNIIFYGNSNSQIFNIDIKAKSWSLMRAGDGMVIKFYKENDETLAMFRWDTVVGICDVTGLSQKRNDIPEETITEEVPYVESVEM